MTAVERIKEAMHLLKLVDEESHEHDGDYEFAHSIAQDAVYCQVMVDRIVWRCNEVINPGLPEPDPTADRPTGSWTYDKDGLPRCSKCHERWTYETDFCPSCGADMRGEDE